MVNPRLVAWVEGEELDSESQEAAPRMPYRWLIRRRRKDTKGQEWVLEGMG